MNRIKSKLTSLPQKNTTSDKLLVFNPFILLFLNSQNAIFRIKICLLRHLSSFFLNEILDLYTSFSTFAIENGLKLSFQQREQSKYVAVRYYNSHKNTDYSLAIYINRANVREASRTLVGQSSRNLRMLISICDEDISDVSTRHITISLASSICETLQQTELI